MQSRTLCSELEDTFLSFTFLHSAPLILNTLQYVYVADNETINEMSINYSITVSNLSLFGNFNIQCILKYTPLV